MALKISIIICVALYAVATAEEELRDFEFTDSDPEIMIAQESRQYQTIVKPPVKIFKPTGVTNSHRPQYNVDSEEDFKAHREDLIDFFEATTKKSLEKSYKPSYKLRSKEVMIREAVLRALERKDHVGKFAQILPIIRSMSGNQRVALASLVASQVTTPPGRSPLNLVQVRSMFGNNANTSTELMLPILLDMANLIRKAVRPGKELRELHLPQTLPQLLRSLDEQTQSQSQMLRRSFQDPIQTQPQMQRRSLEVPQMQRRSLEDPTQIQRRSLDLLQTQSQMQRRSLIEDDGILIDDEPFETSYEETSSSSTTTKSPQSFRTRQRSRAKPHTQDRNVSKTDNNTIVKDQPKADDRSTNSNTTVVKAVDDGNSTRITTSTTTESSSFSSASSIVSRSLDNSTLDLAADATNQTLTQDIPLAEKLRSPNRYVDRKGNPNLPRRPTFPKPSLPTRRTTAEPNISSLSSRDGLRRRPAPARKLPIYNDGGKCELFTNSLCLHSEDYPTDAIIQSIRRNKAAAGALLADFKDPGEGAVDGITAAQEAKYTAEHYLVSNRRGDTANRDFASAGEAGFMCPSTVKYARPQRARATSGQWKYIVNTGEHTQTLRLEKCLKPKESCTYLTDNFKSKCVQVYNYHRLLTWDQQNGLHMDIFKVPTCCSCHIEGYSVAFPPLGHRTHESSAENFPGEDLSSEHGNGALESVQSTIQRPISKKPPFGLKPLENFPAIGENHNVIPGSGFASSNLDDGDGFSGIASTNPMDSYGNSYFPDTFNQASNVRNIKRQPLRNQGDKSRSPSASSFDGQLPSYLEPPTPNGPSSFGFGKDNLSKYKITNSNQYKRGAPRPQRRPIRKNISGAPDDLMSSGTSAVETQASSIESLEDFNDDLEEPDIVVASNYPPHKATIAPKLQANIVVEGASTNRPTEQKKKKESLGPVGPNGKRVNYNYHPIIDFFEEDDKADASIDREDSITSYVPAAQTDWKPIDHPVSRNTKNKSVNGRKKHK